MLIEIIQSQKDWYCIIPLILSSKNHRDKMYNEPGVGRRKKQVQRFSFVRWNVMEMGGGDGCTAL